MIERVKKYKDLFEGYQDPESDKGESRGLTEDQIKFLDLHCRQKGSWTYNDVTGKVDINGDFDARDYALYDLEDIEFGVVTGAFLISSNNLKTLKGCPEVVGGGFSCARNKRLESLEFGPKEVGGDYHCNSCSLDSLKGSPEEVKGYFDFSGNYIYTLKGGPKIVGGSFVGKLNSIESVEGAPNFVGGSFNLAQNNIKNLKGCTKEIEGDFIMYSNDLVSLEGGPTKGNNSMNYLIYLNSNLKSLSGCPEETADFDASSCDLQSLDGSPKIVNGYFNVSENKLTSLEGSPEEVIGLYNCSGNEIKDVVGISKFIDGTIDLEDNPIESLKGFNYEDPKFQLARTIWMTDQDDMPKEFLKGIAKTCYAYKISWEQGIIKEWDKMTDGEKVRIYKQVKDLLSEEDLKYYSAMERYLNMKNLL
jgi:hypothetical protein